MAMDAGAKRGRAIAGINVFVKAEQDVPYAYVDRVVSVCREAGMEQLALLTAERRPAP